MRFREQRTNHTGEFYNDWVSQLGYRFVVAFAGAAVIHSLLPAESVADYDLHGIRPVETVKQSDVLPNCTELPHLNPAGLTHDGNYIAYQVDPAAGCMTPLYGLGTSSSVPVGLLRPGSLVAVHCDSKQREADITLLDDNGIPQPPAIQVSIGANTLDRAYAENAGCA